MDSRGFLRLTSLKSKDCANFTPAPVFGDLKWQFLVDAALHAVQLLIMRTLQSSQCKKRIQFLGNPLLLLQRRDWNK